MANNSPNTHSHFSLLLFLILHFTLLHAQAQPPPTTTTHPEATFLLAFKSSADPTNTSLTSWSTTDTSTSAVCTTWSGITCLPSPPHLLTKLVLENHNLTGPFPLPLLALRRLRVLSLSNNRFSAPLPTNLSALSSLKLLFLSHNLFSSALPTTLPPLLFRLHLSFNNLSGPIPSLSPLSHLLTLRLEHNSLSGPIPSLHVSSLQDFNVSQNQLTGPIPTPLSIFPLSSFSNNPSLCGPPLTTPCPPDSHDDHVSTPSVVVTSSPSVEPTGAVKKPASPRMGKWAIIAIILGDVLVLAGIGVLIYCYFIKRIRNDVASEKIERNDVVSGAEKIVFGNVAGGGGVERRQQQQQQQGKMVFLEGEKRFELEDLLKASAEMLGKGAFGTAYKAVLDGGAVVAVKRLKEAHVARGKKEFEEKMEVIGRLRHQNLVGLKAYYFARDEKLLVFDYLPNGSLFWLLHGNRGPGRTPLNWTTRLKIAAGVARGVAFIHNSCRALKLIHGNIKSTNVLIDKTGNACVSDFGLSSFALTSSTNQRSNGYRAPEALDGRRLTQKADVYSFGVLLLEILTGKYPSVVEGSGPYGAIGVGGVVDLPRWVQSVVREEWTAEVFDLELMRYKDIEEEMVGLLQIAMACTAAAPDQRPRMGQVVKMIEEMRGVDVSPLHHTFDSDSPSMSEDTSAVSQ